MNAPESILPLARGKASAAHSRFVQRVRRRYVDMLDRLPPGLPDFATITALISALEKLSNYSLARGGLQAEGAPLVVYVSGHAHSSVDKAATLAGFGTGNIRHVAVDADFVEDGAEVLRVGGVAIRHAHDLEAVDLGFLVFKNSDAGGANGFDVFCGVAKFLVIPFYEKCTELRLQLVEG